ncbi:phosphomannomutase [Anastrepha obliqua]|uniref:phosphomannomutase n=1 Tax=Anastrepha obliqua TaxID=95512 RepID=UPI00240A73F9|nr:phosphomannomutase [Anastrepha obliqua]
MSTTLQRDEILLLFDVDGTLTYPRSNIQPEFEEFIYSKVKPRAHIATVGGSDLEKMLEQLNGNKILDHFDFLFPENGLVQIDHGKEAGKQNIVKHLGEQTLKRFINFVLRYLSELDLPIKRGTFIEFRNGMLNVCPMGRQCTRTERNMFVEYEKTHNVREDMIKVLQKEFADVDLQYSIGGQISFDVFPKGWDKTYSLRYIEANYNFKEIHFFGDKTEPGGNDYEIFIDPRVIAHKVATPEDTKRILTELLQITDS